MSQTAETTTPQTLGQRIDAVLAPLYAEAEQHRAALDQAKTQIEALQCQVASATQGLAKIERRMVDLVRALANQDPVVAAVFGGSSSAEISSEPADDAQAMALAGTATVVEEAQAVAQQGQAAQEEQVEQAVEADDTDLIAGLTPASPAASTLADAEPEPTDLDPATDQAMIDEASALLASPPVLPVSSATKPLSAPADIAAVAERAAAAAALLRQRAGESA